MSNGKQNPKPRESKTRPPWETASAVMVLHPKAAGMTVRLPEQLDRNQKHSFVLLAGVFPC